MDALYHRPELRRFIISGGRERYTANCTYKPAETVRFELSLPLAILPAQAEMYIWLESGGEAIRYTMDRIRLEDDMDVFAVTINMKDMASRFSLEVGLFYFGFDFKANGERVRVIQSPADGQPEFCHDERGDGAFALTVYDRKYPAPTDWYGGIIYHAFVDRFFSSGKCKPKKYAVMNGDWYGGELQYPEYPGAFVANDMFFGGDLWGIIEKLDYLSSLGVTTLYLSPVFEAHSNHKYDTGDFEKVDSMFGGEKALAALLKAAEVRGIAVILDGVFNHTGSDSKYFNKEGTYKTLGAYQSDDSPWREWYSFGETREDYESWWGIKNVPRVNSRLPSYMNYIAGEGGIIDKWTSLGVSGWRLDVVDELSDEFVQAIAERARLSSVSSRSPIIVGEVWEDASCKIAYGHRRHYFLGKQLDSVMNYPVRSALLEYMHSRNAEPMMLALSTIWEHYPTEVVHVLMNLLGTHDTIRIITALAGDAPDEYTNAELSQKRMTPEQYAEGERLVKLAYLINATIPGVPSIYYGDEAGMEGYSDPFNRRPFPWGRENESILEHYRAVGKLRRENSVYRSGELYICRFGIDGLLMFGRGSETETLYTATNRGENGIYITYASGEVLFATGDVTVDENGVRIGADSGAVIKTAAGEHVYANII